MHEIDFYMVDAFSDHAFGGNAAAVCLLDDWLPDEMLLKMARQHNQSETAFIVKQHDGLPYVGLPPKMKLTSVVTPRLPALMWCFSTFITLMNASISTPCPVA